MSIFRFETCLWWLLVRGYFSLLGPPAAATLLNPVTASSTVLRSTFELAAMAEERGAFGVQLSNSFLLCGLTFDETRK